MLEWVAGWGTGLVQQFRTAKSKNIALAKIELARLGRIRQFLIRPATLPERLMRIAANGGAGRNGPGRKLLQPQQATKPPGRARTAAVLAAFYVPVAFED